MYFIFNKYEKMIFNLSTFKDIYKEKIMKKEILSEIDQMKYLFGYKAGKVISEQTKPNSNTQNVKLNSLVGEILKSASEGRSIAISSVYDKFIVTGFSKDKNTLKYTLYGPIGMGPLVGVYMRQVAMTLNIGNLDWKQIYGLWNEGKLKVQNDWEGKPMSKSIFGQPSNEKIWQLYISGIDSMGEPDDNKRKNVMDLIVSIDPKAQGHILSQIKDVDINEYNKLLKILNLQPTN